MILGINQSTPAAIKCGVLTANFILKKIVYKKNEKEYTYERVRELFF